MREILFRGKRLNGDGWAYGDLSFHVQGGFPYVFPADGYDSPDCYAVAPSTVGQFTGLTDKNGVKIFEGDIVVWDYENPDFDGSTYTTPQVVKWDKALCGFLADDDDLDSNCRIVGNIHDNPELLKSATGERNAKRSQARDVKGAR